MSPRGCPGDHIRERGLSKWGKGMGQDKWKGGLQLPCMGINQMQLVAESKARIMSSMYTRKSTSSLEGICILLHQKQRHVGFIVLWSEPDTTVSWSFDVLHTPAKVFISSFALLASTLSALLTIRHGLPWSLKEFPFCPWVYCTCSVDSAHSLFQKRFCSSQSV